MTKHLPRDLMRMLIHTDKLHRNLVEKRMSKLGLHRSQHIMLLCILGFDTPPTQRDIAAALGLSAATVAVTIKKLEASEFVEKARSDGDSRCNRILITEKGKKILESAHVIFDSIDSSTFAEITDEELDVFVAVFDKMQQNLRSCGAELEDCPCREKKG